MSIPTIEISEARRQLNTIDERFRERPVIYVKRHNKDAFAIVDIEYLESILETIEVLSDPETIEALQKSLEDIKRGRVHDHEDVKRELG